ncbi:unnamed protein product [Caenorhabditis nigoni]
MAYAATIHKSQGFTLKNVLVSTSNGFSPSQVYVDISRVKTLEGLHLLDFHHEKVTIDRNVPMEYERLERTSLLL